MEPEKVLQRIEVLVKEAQLWLDTTTDSESAEYAQISSNLVNRLVEILCDYRRENQDNTQCTLDRNTGAIIKPSS